MIDPLLSDALALGLALLLGAAASHKARDPGAFRALLGEYRLLPRRAVGPTALGLAAAEACLALALVVPSARGAAGPGAAGLLLLYSAAIAINLARGRREIECGCGGPAGRPLGPGLLVRNAMLVAAALLAALPVEARPPVWLDRLTLAFAVAALALAWSAAGLLAAAPPRPARRRIPS